MKACVCVCGTSGEEAPVCSDHTEINKSLTPYYLSTDGSKTCGRPFNEGENQFPFNRLIHVDGSMETVTEEQRGEREREGEK